VLKFLQARDPRWVNRPFFAEFDPQAAWLRQLRPAFGEREFFFSRAMDEIRHARRAPAWGQALAPARKPVVFSRVEWE
jgi:hypothetical protein